MRSSIKAWRAPWRVLVGRTVVNGAAVALIVAVLPGVRESTGHPVIGYLVLGGLFGLINALVKPLIQFVALPLLLGSLGLIVAFVDIAIFWLLAVATPVITIDGPIAVAGAGLALALISYMLDNALGLVPPIAVDGQRAGARL